MSPVNESGSRRASCLSTPSSALIRASGCMSIWYIKTEDVVLLLCFIVLRLGKSGLRYKVSRNVYLSFSLHNFHESRKKSIHSQIFVLSGIFQNSVKWCDFLGLKIMKLSLKMDIFSCKGTNVPISSHHIWFGSKQNCVWKSSGSCCQVLGSSIPARIVGSNRSPEFAPEYMKVNLKVNLVVSD